MAGKKSTKTSKTDHVLNLLAGASSQEAVKRPADPAQAAAEPVQTTEAPVREAALQEDHPPAATQGRHLMPPILEVARSNNEALSETIHNALESALEEELAAEAEPLSEPRQSIPPGEDPSTPPPAFSGGPLPEPVPPIEETAPAPAVPPEEASQQPPPSAEAASRPSSGPLMDDFEQINVMELLVDERLSRYIRMFHLCECPRCLADAKALALTRLPAKYVVLTPSVKAPMLSLYQAKYDSDVTTQIIYACKEVMERPRHTSS